MFKIFILQRNTNICLHKILLYEYVFYFVNTLSITLCDAGVITGKYGYCLCTFKQSCIFM
jgi:hypothetical protein